MLHLECNEVAPLTRNFHTFKCRKLYKIACRQFKNAKCILRQFVTFEFFHLCLLLLGMGRSYGKDQMFAVGRKFHSCSPWNHNCLLRFEVDDINRTVILLPVAIIGCPLTIICYGITAKCLPLVINGVVKCRFCLCICTCKKGCTCHHCGAQKNFKKQLSHINRYTYKK